MKIAFAVLLINLLALPLVQGQSKLSYELNRENPYKIFAQLDLVVAAASNIQEKDSSKNTSRFIVKARFFTFRLQQCRISGSTVNCDLLITNNEDKEKEIRFFQLDKSPISRTFDDQGNEAYIKNNSIANRGRNATVTLIPGVETKAKATFESISPDSNKLKLVSLVFANTNGQTLSSFKVEYRDAPLSR